MPRSDTALLFDALPVPIDVECDAKNSRLYWIGRGDPTRGNTLNRCRTVNRIVQTPEIPLSGLEEGIGLALDEASGGAHISCLGGSVHVTSLDRSGETCLPLSDARSWLASLHNGHLQRRFW
jgi:hypothetical protein